MGPGVGHAPEGRSATRAYLGLIGELPRVNSRASLLSLTPPTGMPALPDPPQHTQRRDPALTSTCRRAWSEQLARDVGCSCTSISRLCSLRPPGGFHERYEGAKGTGNDGGGWSCASRAAKATRRDVERPQQAHLPRRCLACRAPREASEGGRMRAGLRSARRAKPAETLT